MHDIYMVWYFVFAHAILQVIADTRLNDYIDTKTKCRHIKNWPVKGLWGRCLSVWGPCALGFCLGWSSNFVGSESGQIQSFNLLQNMVSNRTQYHPTSIPARHFLYIYCTLTQGRGEGGGRVEPERRLEGQQFTKLGRKYKQNWLYLQSIHSDKHLPQSPYTGQFF